MSLPSQVFTTLSTMNAAVRFTNGNVGIGTTSPTSRLTVAGGGVLIQTTTGSVELTTASGGGGWESRINIVGLTTGSLLSGTRFFSREIDQNFGIFNVTNNRTQFRIITSTSGSSGDTMLLLQNGGNVGIGLTTPTQQFQVSGNIGVENGYFEGLNESNNITGNTEWTLIRSRNGAGIWGYKGGSNNQGSLIFKTHTTYNTPVERLRITESGGVGIGTDSPNKQLDVNGTGAFRNKLTIAPSSDENLGIHLFSNSIDGASASAYNGGIESWWGIGLRCRTDNVTRHMFDTRSGDFWALGNVGIGTTSPNSRFAVANGDDLSGDLITLVGASTEPSNYQMKIVKSMIGTSGGGPQFSYNFVRSQFGGFNGVQLSLHPNGNVGIGTTSPGYRLDVNGSIGLPYGQTIHAYGNPNTRLFETAWTGQGILGDVVSIFTPGAQNSNSAMNIVGLGGTSFVHIPGNVGIGTASPETTLDVRGTSQFIGSGLGTITGNTTRPVRIGWSNANGSYLDIFGYRTSTGTDWNTASTRIQQTIDVTAQSYIEFNGTGKEFSVGMYANNGQGLTVNSGGSVGIGTASPAYTLDLATSIVGDVARFRNTNSGGYSTIQLQNTTRTWFVGAGAAGAPGYKDKFYILAGGGPGSDFVMTPSGNVGIGTESPRDRLSVRGNLQLQDDAIIWARSEGFYHGGSLTLAAGYVSSDTVNPETARASIVIHGFNPGDDSLSGDIQLRTSSTTRLHIERDSGNVGINTISPIGKLTVRDDTNDTGDNAGGLFVTGSDTTNKRLHMGYHATNNYGWVEAVHTGVDLQPLSLQPRGGNVGIGTASPQTKLDVNGTVSMKNGTVTAIRDTAYSLGNLQAKWTGTTPTQLAIALVSGTNSGGYAAWVSTYNGTGYTNSPTSTSFITVAAASAGSAGDIIIVNVFLLSSNTFYRVTAQVGSGYTNNPIIIEKLL